ncbi:class I SAM-dependent methyltransferase [Amycolatopsis australiensis]|uniref:Methyltransferase domain-containing protein n=1 Tax=Amycolatopsis australiensis TaxID=546364 RepID=A0A1K1SEM0_9PSEU|nr:class I SAM-dependent methyltransferase [Amycolatopsis australiensis]SFW82373.1 Methyltransferase domain-containing protein [Amycolatopsis australiensis]
MSEHRVRFAALFDAEVRRHNERFRAAAAVRPGEDVLDVGCGTGESTREAAAAGATALGVDVSAQAIARARELGGAAFEVADAQTHPFPAAAFDVVLSRFGAMFFADPAAAFANLARALRPGGRLVLLVWQERHRNEWYSILRDAIAPGAVAPPPGPHFSLGDPARTRALLEGAGLTGVEFTGLRDPVCYGPDAATACEFALGLKDVQQLLAQGDEQSVSRLRDAFAAHETADGVLLGARTWIVTARLSAA